MWFNNALIYQYTSEDTFSFEALNEERLKPCPPHARFSYGWLPTINDELAHEVAGSLMLCLGKEERILPRGVIQKFLAERVAALENQQGRAVKRAEKAQMAEELEFELLPKSFCIQKRLLGLFDTVSKRLIINTTSETQALQFIALLRKSIPSLHVEPLSFAQNLALCFAEWISNPSSLSPSFQLASDCLLFSLHDEKKRVTCKGYELPADEILTLLSQGLVAAEVSLIWNERIQLTLTHDLIVKRLKSLDYLIDEFNELRELDDDHLQQDAALTLLCGELRNLTNDLLKALTPSQEKEKKMLEPAL